MSLADDLLKHPRNDKIRFKEEEHEYEFFPSGDFRKTSEMVNFQGITSWISRYSGKKFDADKIAKQCNNNPNSKYYGWGEEKIKQHWIDRRNDGDDIHKAVENFVNTGVIDEDYEPYLDAIMDLFIEYDIEPIVSEITVYDEHMGRATNIDIVGVRDGKLIPIDTKTYKDGMEYSAYNGETFNAPLHDLPNSKYDKVCLQVAIPSKWIRELYQLPVGEGYCLLLNENQQELIPALDYSDQVEKLYEWESPDEGAPPWD